MVQFDSGGGSDSEVDQELQDSQQTQGSLAEPELDQVSRQMATAQDQDLQEVQAREQQSVSPTGTTATVDGGGDQTDTTADPEPVDAEPVEASAPETTARPTTGTPGQTGVAPEPSQPPEEQVEEPPTETITLPSGQQVVRSTETGRVLGTPEEVEARRQAQRGQAAEQFERQVEEQTGRDVDIAAEDVQVRDGQFTLTGPAFAEVSRAAARGAGVDFGGRARRADLMADITGRGPAVESGGFEVGTSTIRQVEREAFRQAQQGTGGINVEAVERAGERRQTLAEIEREFEEQIEEQTGREVDLERGDFTITDEGQVELTQSGRDKVATAPLTGFVEDAEQEIGGLGVDVPQFAVVPGPPGQRSRVRQTGTERIEFGELVGDVERTVFGDRPVTPGPRAAPRQRVGTEPLLGGGGPIAEGVGEVRDFGDFFGGMTVTQFGEREVVPGPRIGEREVVGEKTVDEVLAEISAEVDDLVVLGDPAFEGVTQRRGRAGAAARQEAREFTGVGFEEAQGFSETFIEFIPRVAAGAPQLAVNVGDFGAEFVGAVSPEFGERQQVAGPRVGTRPQLEGPDLDRVDELISGAEQTAINAGAVFAADFAEDPSVVGARAAGGLAASAVTFGAAAAIGPRTSLATRAAIQPGEEALGFGGFGATRRIAGRGAAQRLFPNKEPLIFSEEAFLRGVRGVSRRVGGRVPSIELEAMTESNVEGLLTELRTEGRIQRRRIRQRGRDPRQLVEGPVIASGPRAIGRAELGEGEFVIRERFDAETEVDSEVSEDVEAAEEDAGTDGAGQVGGGEFELEIERRTGTGQVEVMRQRVEVEGRQEMEFETETEARMEPIGVRVQPGELGLDTPGELGLETPVEAPGVTQAVGEVGKVGPGLDELLDQEFGEVLPPQLEFRPRESEIERTPVELELRLELAEQEIERSELELELEQEAELRREFEGGPDRRRREEGMDVDMGDELFSRTFRFERTTDPFDDIESDLMEIDQELEDLG